MCPDSVLYEKKDGVGLITLNRPERMNAIDKDMRMELGRFLDSAESDDEVRVLVLTGAGKAFCSGGYSKSVNRLFEQPPIETRQTVRNSTGLLLKIRESSRPFIAAVNGVAVGAGCNLALVCDIRLASEKARFGQVFVRRGLHPDWGGTFSATRLAGTAKACELIFTGRIIDAWEAREIGLVNRVAAEDEFEQAWRELARQIAQGHPRLLYAAKRAVYQAQRSDLASMVELEVLTQLTPFQTGYPPAEGQTGIRERPAAFQD